MSLKAYLCTFKNEPCLCKVPTKLTLAVFRQLCQSVPAINTLTSLVVCQLLQSFPAPASNTQMQSNYWLLRKLSSLRKCRDVYVCTFAMNLLFSARCPPSLPYQSSASSSSPCCTSDQHTNLINHPHLRNHPATLN